MSTLRVELRDALTGFRPGDEIHGSATWVLDEAPEGLEARLFWYTAGKGESDVEIVETRRIHTNEREGRQELSFTAPSAPFSFSGKLISLIWAIELVAASGGDDVGRQQIVISPTGEEIRLDKPAIDDRK